MWRWPQAPGMELNHVPTAPATPVAPVASRFLPLTSIPPLIPIDVFPIHMLSFKSHSAAPDHSFELRDTVDWSVGCVRTLEQHADVVALAYDPVTSLLACGTCGPRQRLCHQLAAECPLTVLAWMGCGGVGTTKGIVRVFGAPGVEMDVKLPQPASGQAGVKFLQIACNVSKLLCIGALSMPSVSYGYEYG